ncbi:unnamed protein product [Prorocentrum cordatum]|uniref:Uncharacterized protein n=1 Tax=Prorocentrum cordatum TaxID=2364126 RepID=A0ABN9YD34_9DINO|nr:unnamed protein product [Polarella glacialis]
MCMAEYWCSTQLSPPRGVPTPHGSTAASPLSWPALWNSSEGWNSPPPARPWLESTPRRLARPVLRLKSGGTSRGPLDAFARASMARSYCATLATKAAARPSAFVILRSAFRDASDLKAMPWASGAHAVSSPRAATA